MSGFGPNHRDDSDDSETESARIRGERESCQTTGFNFYVQKIDGLQNAMINRERELFSPPFKTRAEQAQH